MGDLTFGCSKFKKVIVNNNLERDCLAGEFKRKLSTNFLNYCVMKRRFSRETCRKIIFSSNLSNVLNSKPSRPSKHKEKYLN